MAAAREARNAPTVGVIESPQLPARPDRPRRGPAMLVGFLIGAAVALVRLVLQE
jgi:LPS O-antigen subunit length determinant protein (WzzB/FepE family)